MSFAKHCRSLLIPTAALVLALGLAASRTLAHEGHDHSASMSGAKGEVLMWIKDAETKLIELAEATPEGKYNYRPAKGVRSTGEVFMHVAGANYGIPTFVGVKPPEGFVFDTYEKSKTKKADIVAELKSSFAHMESAWNGMTDEDMEKPAEFFGMKTTARGAYLLLLSHCHEHLGQSIAYARGNGVVPPWTARQDAAAAAAKKTATGEGKSATSLEGIRKGAGVIPAPFGFGAHLAWCAGRSTAHRPFGAHFRMNVPARSSA